MMFLASDQNCEMRHKLRSRREFVVVLEKSRILEILGGPWAPPSMAGGVCEVVGMPWVGFLETCLSWTNCRESKSKEYALESID
jgi:hypothetical protein